MSGLENWNLRRFGYYVKQAEAGEHDYECEQRERSSLCHCSKRRRERAGKTELPQIWFAAPTCGGCNKEVDFAGDGFDCPRCHASWGRWATDGDQADEWTDNYGPEAIGGPQFGERLIVLATTQPAGPKETQ